MSNVDVSALYTKIFADGANRDEILALNQNPLIRGFTTNPTLMRAAGVADYEYFARDILEVITDKPISFEVFADDFSEMRAQALEIASWGSNVNVKIPVMNTQRRFAGPLIAALSSEGVTLNVTAIMTAEQVRGVVQALDPAADAIISVFAGRIADTGRDPLPVMAESKQLLSARPGLQLLWASPREVLNIMQADAVGCDIITVTNSLLSKLGTVGKDLDDFSLETVEMFYRDAAAAGYEIDTVTQMRRQAAQ